MSDSFTLLVQREYTPFPDSSGLQRGKEGGRSNGKRKESGGLGTVLALSLILHFHKDREKAKAKYLYLFNFNDRGICYFIF